MMLQINSRFAEQKVTVQCQNTKVTPSFDGFKNGDLFMLEDANTGMVELKTLQDGCSVMNVISLML